MSLSLSIYICVNIYVYHINTSQFNAYIYNYISYLSIINVLLDLNIHTAEYSIYIYPVDPQFLLLMISLWFGTRFEASAKPTMGVGRFMILFQLATCTFHWSLLKETSQRSCDM